MRRFLRYIATPTSSSTCRHTTIRHHQQQQQRRCIHSSPLIRWMETLPVTLTTSQPSPPPPPQQQQQHDRRATSGMLSQFYRGLATQNIEQLWPLYSTMYQHHLHTRLTRNNYRQLVQVAARSPKTQRNLHRLLAMMEDMQQLGIPLRLSDYNIIMAWIGGATVPERRPKHVTDALGWLTTMESQDLPVVEPNVVTYNTLIHVASRANDILTAQRLYHAMLAKGIEADAYTYTTLLHSMATMGDVEGVQEMVTRLERKGLGALLHSTVTWNILLDCYYTSSSSSSCAGTHSGDDDDLMTATAVVEEDGQQQKRSMVYQSKADDMFEAMVNALTEKNTTTTATAPMADNITFQIHMDHLLRHNRRDDALLILSQQQQPTITMYNKLFASFMKDTATTTTTSESLSSIKELSQLRQLYKSLLQHTSSDHLQPTSDTLYTLINALLDHHDTTFTLEAFVHLCQEKKLSPCQDLLDRLSGVLQDQDALLLLDQENLPSPPSID